MASKLPKLVLPAYDFKTMKATYRHYAEAVCKANPGMRGAVTKDFVDKGWVSAVMEFLPGNQAKREKMFRQVSIRWPFLRPSTERPSHRMTGTLDFFDHDDRILGPEEARRRALSKYFGSFPWNKNPGDSHN
jgi:hypothetical protein